MSIAITGEQVEPWFTDASTSEESGFVVSVALAVADKMDVDPSEVEWAWTASDNEEASVDLVADLEPDVDSRPGRVGVPYYRAPQAIVVGTASRFARVGGLDELATAALGALEGSTSLRAIEELGTQDAPLVFRDTREAVRALREGQVDGLVADLPTAFRVKHHLGGAGLIVGQFETKVAPAVQYALRPADPELQPCLEEAVDELKASGDLRALEEDWMSGPMGVPVLTRD